METNKKKSRVMNFRLPKDRPKTDPVINGFPSVQEYQYLGVVLTDMMVLDADKKKRSKIAKLTEKRMRSVVSGIKSLSARLQITSSLGFAKASYLMEILSTYDSSMLTFFRLQVGLLVMRAFGLHEKTRKELVWEATGLPQPEMIIRK